MKFYLAYLNYDMRIRYQCISGEMVKSVLSDFGGPKDAWEYCSFLTSENEWVGLNQFVDHAFDFNSTNGIYLVDGTEEIDLVETEGKWKGTRRKVTRRFLVLTEKALVGVLNDERINTLGANKRLFYQGKYINPKTFIYKQLLINHEYSDDISFDEVDEADIDEQTMLIWGINQPYHFDSVYEDEEQMD